MKVNDLFSGQFTAINFAIGIPSGSRASLFQKIVAVIHANTERIQCINNLLSISD